MDANKTAGEEARRHQRYGHLPPITKTIQVRRTGRAGHCWRSRDKLISDVLLWTPTYGRAKAGRPARTYIQQLWEDKGCRPEDLPEAMNDREKWREGVRDIRASSTTWWWWWWWWWWNGPWNHWIPDITVFKDDNDVFIQEEREDSKENFIVISIISRIFLPGWMCYKNKQKTKADFD